MQDVEKMAKVMVDSLTHATKCRILEDGDEWEWLRPAGYRFVWNWARYEYETVKEPSHEWVNHYSTRYATKAEADANAGCRDWCERVEL